MSGVNGMSGVSGTQSPMILSAIENQFVQHFTSGFSIIGTYATELFYILAGLEIVLFGLIWAMRQEGGLGNFVFKIFKLAVIFFVITQFPMLLQSLINGFTRAGYDIAGSSAGVSLFNPSHMWNYGFDASMALMKLSLQAATTNMALSNLYMLMGSSLILLFSLIGAQIILMVSAFYLVSLLALLLVPLGAFFASRNFLERAIESVFRMGARVFSLMVVLGLAESIWGQFDLSALTSAADAISAGASGNAGMQAGIAPLTLMAPLGFLIASLVITVLCFKLPGLVVEAVGHIGGKLQDEVSGAESFSSGASSVTAASSGAVSQVAAGSSLSGTSMVTSGAGGSYGAQGVAAATSIQGAGGMGGGAVSVSSNVNSSGSAGVAGGAGLLGGADGKNKTKAGADMGISRDTLSKLKTTFKQAMKEGK